MFKKIFKGLIYLIFLLIVVLAAVEILAKKVPGWNQWVNFVGNPDHRIPPNSAKDINSDGIRSRREAVEFLEEDFNIIFLGDSFTYGLWLTDNQAIPQQFEKIIRQNNPDKKINVANFGWVSSSPLLSYRLLKDIGKKYNPDLIIQIIDMTDVGDDLYYDAIINKRNIYRYTQWLPTTTLLLQKSIRKHTHWDNLSEALFGLPRKRYFIVQKPIAETRYAFDFMKQHIDLIYDFSRKEFSAKYMMFVMPRYFQYNIKESPEDWEKLAGEYSVPEQYAMEPFKYFDTMSKQSPYPVISLLTDFQKTNIFPTVFEKDAHLNKEGALFAAQSVARYCEKLNCLMEKKAEKNNQPKL